MQRILIALIAVVALAAGGYLLFSPPANEDPAPEVTAAEVPETETRLAAPVEAREAAGAGVDGDAEPARIEVASPPKAGAHPAASLFEPPSEDPDAILVRVVKPDGVTPLPGAEVFHVDSDSIDEDEALTMLSSSGSVHSVLDTFSRRFRADAKGEVRVPYAGSELVLGARTPKYFSFQMEADPKPGETVVVKTVERHSLQVQVFGSDGQPVEGAPVAFVLTMGSMQQPMLTVRTEGEDGIATLEDVAPLTNVVPMPAKVVEVALLLPLAETVSERVELDDVQEEPYYLDMPPVGAVTVQVHDFDGKPVEGEFPVSLASAQEDTGFHWWRPVGVPEMGKATAVTASGEAEFPFVGLGMKLEASVRMPDYPEALRLEFDGPVREGETVQITLRPDVQSTVLVLRCVDEEGEPVPDTEMDLTFFEKWGDSNSSDWETLTTDAEGKFRYPYLFSEERPLDAEVRLEVRQEDSQGNLLKFGELPLASAYPPGQVELGDVVLTTPPLVAAGTVLSPAGTPVAGARVVVEWKNFYGSNEEHFWWNGDWRIAVETDANGRFTMLGKPEKGDASEYRLSSHADGYRAANAPLILGDSNVTIQLLVNSSLAGRLLVDDGLPVEALEVNLVHEDENGSTNTRGASVDGDDGRFQWESIDPGTYRVEVVGHEGEPPVFVADGVQVLEGQDNQDPRLDPIDLRGVLRHIQVRCVDEDGDLVNGVAMTSLDPENMFWDHDWDGTLDFFTARGSIDVRLSSDDYQPIELRNQSESCDAVFKKGAELLFVLSSPIDLPENHYVTVGLTPANQENHWPLQTAEFDERGEARIGAPGDGEFTLRIGVEKRQEFFRHSTTVGGDAVTPKTILITDSRAPQNFTLSVDAERVLEALENLQ